MVLITMMEARRNPPRRRSNPLWDGRWARYTNAVLGAWLFVSTFLWAHGREERQNAWVLGILMLVVALAAARTSSFRWANTVLAVWLLNATLSAEHDVRFTLWHNLALAVVVFLLSLVPSASLRDADRRGRA